MTEKIFLYKLRRGLGSAIIEISENSNHEKYYKTVLKCCLKNISNDNQTEGTKGHYLYTAICALGNKDKFEDVLIESFMKRLKHNLFLQIADILMLYAEDGSTKSREALNGKYNYFIDKLPKQKSFSMWYCEREQFEYLLIWKVEKGKWLAFKKCIYDISTIMKARKDDLCSDYDWFLSHCEDTFGKAKVWNYLEKAATTELSVHVFLDTQRNMEESREEYLRLHIEPVVTLESYISSAKELEDDQYADVRMWSLGRHFLRRASQEDISSLVSYIENEPSNEVRANMLRIFRNIDYPGDIEELIKCAKSDCERLREISIESLKRFKSKRIHDFAINLIADGALDEGLLLLIKNWRITDEAIIRKQILSTKKVSHSLQQNIREIYSKRRSSSCKDILMHVYENGECTLCRMGIVKAMIINKVLSEKVLKECQFDSYEGTRKLARETTI